MKPSLALALVAVSLATPAAVAAEERRFDVPAGRLSDTLPLLSRQAGVSISVEDAELWDSLARPVRGRMDVGAAIDRLLVGTLARAVRVSPTSWRIERRTLVARGAYRPAPSPRTPPRPTARVSDDHLVAAPHDEIIVTATKADLPHSHYAGVATLIDGGDLAFEAERGTDAILSRVATVSSTHLGAGRNKLFIRGIADSSFTGPTQATVGQYLGDIRLSYNAPDPDLRLYDIDGVEVLEGPQGTLYGAGSLGGIIRAVPKGPDARALTLQAVAGLTLTQHGEPGGDIAGIVNIPLSDRGHAVRLVGYMISEGGYIDNPLRGQNDVNRVHIRGGRGMVRIAANDDWTIDVGGIYQAITSDDAQYADKDAPPLTRRSMVVQNASARYAMGSVVITGDWGDLRFQSSNGVIRHHLDERFDASLAPGQSGRVDVIRLFAPAPVAAASTDPRVLDQRNRTTMLVSESRLSRPFHDGFGWVVGASVVDNRARQQRAFSLASLSTALPGVRNSITEFTGYAEGTVELSREMILSAGARLSHMRLGGQAEDVPLLTRQAGSTITASRSETDFLPAASLLVTPFDTVKLYLRYQEGFRPGGLAIDGNFVRRFRNDRVRTFEAGLRFGDQRHSAIDAQLALSHSLWRDIQADFIDSNGFPSTANIGDGRITSLTGAVALRATPTLTVEIGGVYNHSRVDELAPQVAAVFAATPARLGRIPNVASHALRGSVTHVSDLGNADLRLHAWANYVGPSRLGIGPVLGEGQGDYVDTGLGVRYGSNARGLALTVTNLLDSRGNRFALGTPFLEGSAGFLTPLRPRTIRIALDVAY